MATTGNTTAVPPPQVVGDFMTPMRLGLTALFGLVGVYLRYFINVLFIQHWGLHSFWSSFTENMIGSIVIAIVYVAGIENSLLPVDVSYALMTGLLGGFTTFSGYALDSVKYFDNREDGMGFLSLLLPPILGWGLTYLTLYIVRRAVAG